jgi:hypothetical protein
VLSTTGGAVIVPAGAWTASAADLLSELAGVSEYELVMTEVAERLARAGVTR